MNEPAPPGGPDRHESGGDRCRRFYRGLLRRRAGTGWCCWRPGSGDGIGADLRRGPHRALSACRAATAASEGLLMQGRSRLTKVLVALLLVATVAFAIGAALEKSQHHTEAAVAAPVSSETTGEGQSAPAVESGAGETAAQLQAETGGSGQTHSEKLLGLDPEATALVVVAVSAPLLPAAAVWMRPDQTLLLLVVAAAMLVFAALDVREAVHQSDESNTGLLILASVIAALHLGSGAVAAYLSRLAGQARPAQPPPRC